MLVHDLRKPAGNRPRGLYTQTALLVRRRTSASLGEILTRAWRYIQEAAARIECLMQQFALRA